MSVPNELALKLFHVSGRDQLFPVPTLTRINPTPVPRRMCLPNKCRVDSFISIQSKSLLAERVFADPADKRNFRSEPRARNRLIRSLPTVIDAVARAQGSLAGSRQAFDLHRQTCGITPNHCYPGSTQ